MALLLTALAALALLAAARDRFQTCNPNLSAHGACASPADVCRSKSYDDYYTCLPPIPAGGGCYSSLDCEAGSACSEHEGALGTCGPPPPIGAFCYPYGPPACGRLASCNGPSDAPACVRARALGEACNKNDVCAGEAVCGAAAAGGAKTCRAFQAVGEFCIFSGECGPDGWCKDRKCAPLAREGETCNWNWTCDGTLECVITDVGGRVRVCKQRPGATPTDLDCDGETD